MASKRLVKNIAVTEVLRSHPCRANKKHKLSKGDKRLTVKEDQKSSNYCRQCSLKLIDKAISDLNRIKTELSQSERLAVEI